MLSQWISSQTLGLAAFLSHSLSHSPRDPVFVASDRLILAACVKCASVTDFRRYPLPVLLSLSTALSDASDVRSATALSLIDEAIDQIMGGDQSAAEHSKVAAYHILFGERSAETLLKLLRSLFGRLSNPDPPIALLEALLIDIRDPWISTDRRLTTISTLSGIMQPAHYWPQIEHLLLHSQFSWPLLVFRGHIHSGATAALALPVSADVTFAAKSKPRLFATDLGVLDLRPWSDLMRKAILAGRDLWRSKHGNTGEFRRTIESAWITFNFQTACAIVAPILIEARKRVVFTDTSAGVCLAQLVLQTFLGRTNANASAITGCIGTRVIRDDGSDTLDFKVERIEQIEEKFLFVTRNRSFERLVVPTDNMAEVVALRDKHEDDIEILQGSTLQNVADVVQVRGWRNTQYVRCPELAWALHGVRSGSPGPLPFDDPDVGETVGAIQKATDTVLNLRHFLPLTVLSALWHLNDTVRTSMSPTPPALSWAVIRAIEAEQDTRFWHLLWHICGASSATFADFTEQRSADQVFSNVVRLLNAASPSIEEPSLRAPEIVVLIGPEAFKKSIESQFNPGARAYAVWPVLERLRRSDALDGPLVSAHRDLVGRTRLILLSDGECDRSVDRGSSIPPNYVNAMMRLSVMRYGFDHNVAGSVLEVSGKESLKTVRALAAARLLRYGQGMYHMPPGVRAWSQARIGKREAPQFHFRAGSALAPYVAHGIKVRARGMDVAFGPAEIHEASWHLEQARRGWKALNDGANYQKARKAIQHLTRFVEHLSWGTVSEAYQAGDLDADAWDNAKLLLKWERASVSCVHPSHLELSARVAAKRAKVLSPSHHEFENTVAESVSLFEEALANCKCWPSETSQNQLKVCTSYMCHLIELGRVGSRTTELLREGESLLSAGANPTAVWADWWDLAADRLPEHREAWSLYKIGIEHTPSWAQLWVKGVGAACLAGLSEEVDELLANTDPDAARSLVDKCSRARNRQFARAPSYVKRRWVTGTDRLSRLT